MPSDDKRAGQLDLEAAVTERLAAGEWEDANLVLLGALVAAAEVIVEEGLIDERVSGRHDAVLDRLRLLVELNERIDVEGTRCG